MSHASKQRRPPDDNDQTHNTSPLTGRSGLFPAPPPKIASLSGSSGVPRAIYFVDDEVTNCTMPPIVATGSAAGPSPKDSNAASTSRRKQSNPHRVGASAAAAAAEAKSAPVAEPKDAIETGSDSEDNNLVIDLGESTSSSGGASGSPAKKRKASSDDKKTAADEQKAKKRSSTPKKSPATPAKKAATSTPASAKSTPTKPDAKSSSVKKRRSSAGKFDQVENELEAMFAGVEEAKTPTAPTPPAKGSKKSSAATSSDGAATPTKKKAEQSNKESPANTSASKVPTPALLLAKKRGRPTKEEALLRQQMGILPKKKKKSSPAKAAAAAATPAPKPLITPPPMPVPFVRVEGGESSVVVNGPSVASKNLSVVNESEHRKRIDAMGGTTRKFEDHKPPDDTWLCAFCHKGSHVQQMGDLFGPYYVQAAALPAQHPAVVAAAASHNSPSKQEAAAKFIVDPQRKKKKRKVSGGGGAAAAAAAKDQAIEVWFHEDCVCWMPDLRLIGSKLYGLEEALSGAGSVNCSVCGKSGATMACVHASGCKQATHFPCALRWGVYPEEFQAFCEKHHGFPVKAS